MKEKIENRIKRMKARIIEIDVRIEAEKSDGFRMYLQGRKDELNYEIALLELDLMPYGKEDK